MLLLVFTEWHIDALMQSARQNCCIVASVIFFS